MTNFLGFAQSLCYCHVIAIELKTIATNTPCSIFLHDDNVIVFRTMRVGENLLKLKNLWSLVSVTDTQKGHESDMGDAKQATGAPLTQVGSSPPHSSSSDLEMVYC
jgi:hypothetical protein